MPDSSFSVVNPSNSSYSITLDAASSGITPVIEFGDNTGVHSFYVSTNNTLFIDGSSYLNLQSINLESTLSASEISASSIIAPEVSVSNLNVDSYLAVSDIYVGSTFSMNQWSGSNPINTQVGILGLVVGGDDDTVSSFANISIPGTNSAIPTCKAVGSYVNDAIEGMASKYALLDGTTLDYDFAHHQDHRSNWQSALGMFDKADVTASNVGQYSTSWRNNILAAYSYDVGNVLNIYSDLSSYSGIVPPIAYRNNLVSYIEDLYKRTSAYATKTCNISEDSDKTTWLETLELYTKQEIDTFFSNYYTKSQLYTSDYIDNNFVKNDGTNLTSPDNWRNKLKVYSKDETKNLIMQMQCVVYDTVNNTFMVWNDEAQKWVTIGIKGSIADEYYPVYSDASIQPPSPNP